MALSWISCFPSQNSTFARNPKAGDKAQSMMPYPPPSRRRLRHPWMCQWAKWKNAWGAEDEISRYPSFAPVHLAKPQKKGWKTHLHGRTWYMDVLCWLKTWVDFQVANLSFPISDQGALILGVQLFHHFDPLELQPPQRRSRVRWLLVRWSHQSQGFQANPTEHYVRLISWSLGGSLGWKNFRNCRKS